MTKIILSVATVSLLTTALSANLNDSEITISSATKSEQSIKDVTSNIEVITGAELESKNITTISEALNLVSGIDYTSNGGMGKSTSITLRGMSSKRILVLIDGVRFNDITGLSGAPFADLMINNIKQIEVIKGAQSGVWGADASAGVINIITKNEKIGTHGSANIEIGSFNTKKASFNISNRTKKAFIQIGINEISTDGFSAQVPNGDNVNDYEDDGYKNTTTTLKAGLNIDDDNKINLAHTIIKSDNEFDGFNAPNDALSKSESNHEFTSLNYNNKNKFSTVNIFAKNSSLNRYYPNGWTKDYNGRVKEYGFKSKVTYNKKDFTVFGIDYKSFEHKNTIDKQYNNKAFFITNSNNLKALLGGDTIVTQSLRRDTYDVFKNKTTGKIGLKHNYKFLKDFSSSANYGTAYNVPTLYNLYSAYGNENLTPEETKSYDLTLSYKNTNISYFSSKTNDMIEYDFSTSKYSNSEDSIEVRGIEFSYKQAVGIESFLKLSYTRLNGESIRRKAKEQMKVSVDYFGIKKLHLNINGIYVGERFDDSAKTKQTGKYTVSNFIANYKLIKNTTVYAKVNNITDKYYQTIDGYSSSPRAYYAGLKVKF
ncbi:MAG TPA: TonB-dependent receptor [Arcobacter sp.]|nr:TonB-dependent receptor [Arcobacter sp.]